MKTNLGRLTQGRARFLIRLSSFMGITFALAGILLLLASPPEMPALKDVAQAAKRRFVNYSLLFPKFRELTGTRATPFEFQEPARIKVRLRVKESEPPLQPKPDVAGLTLVGTAPGNSRALAVLLDGQSGQMTNIGLGDKIRNSVVKDILADKIVLALDAEEAEIALASIQGSENFQRQLQGLPPLPEQQTSENKQARQRTSSMPTQTSGNAILVAASSRTPPTVVTQSAPSSRSTSPQSQQSASSGSPSGSGAESSPSSSNQNSTTGGQSGGSSMQNQASSPTGQSSNRSLGISGYMLSLEKQQELGLQETGLLITSVRDSSSSIQENDVILTIAGQPFGTLGEAKNLLQSVEGGSAELKVFRNGAPTQISAPLK